MYLKRISILSFLLLFGCSPLHLLDSKESIREQILKATPIGMRLDKVEKVIKKNIISNNAEFYPNTFELPGPRIPGSNGIPVYRWPRGALPNGGCIGGTLGSSGLWEEAEGWWGFDKDMKLIDVFVFKHYNGM